MLILILIISLDISLTFSQKIATQKCEEYAKAVYTNEKHPEGSGKDQAVPHCYLSATPLIIGGIEATVGEFPHMAVLGFGSSPNDEYMTWECGGSLISDMFVITAAHCEKSPNSGLVQKVRLGRTTLNASDSYYYQQEKFIVERHIHPNHKHSAKINDIALYKVDSPVKFSPFVRPACLSTDLSITPAKTKVVATGYGHDAFDQMTGKLMKVDLQIFNKSVCENTFNVGTRFSSLKDGVVDSMICAGYLEGARDTCQGDSGGPLQIVLNTPYCMYSLLGVTSFGKNCGLKSTASIYTRVASYLPWIEGIVWK